MERPSHSEVTETRNSPLRERTAGLITTITKHLHQAFPSLTPDHITLLGSVGTAVGSALAVRKNRALAFTTLALSNLSDSSYSRCSGYSS